MINKVYDKIKKFLSQNYKFLIGTLIFYLVLNYQFPYYINTPGGLINVSSRVEIENSSEIKGSLNMAYVSELKATIPTLIIAYFNKNWDIKKQEEVIFENETVEEANFRDRLLLKEATNNAIIVGFEKAGKSVTLTNKQVFVTYVSQEADTDLKIGDEILSVDGENVAGRNELDKILQRKQDGDTLNIVVKKDKKTYHRYAKLKLENNRLIVGLLINEDMKVETIPEVKLTFKKSESGPSGGLMTALAIYNYLTEIDITKGKKIVGTGTIDLEGNVGSIGGVKYKLKGAIKKGAELFIVPNGENYEEALQVKDENNYDIEIIGVSTFEEALNYLVSFS